MQDCRGGDMPPPRTTCGLPSAPWRTVEHFRLAMPLHVGFLFARRSFVLRADRRSPWPSLVYESSD